jgi:hypothetical protein
MAPPSNTHNLQITTVLMLYHEVLYDEGEPNRSSANTIINEASGRIHLRESSLNTETFR